MARNQARRPPGELEAAILGVLRAAEAPMSVQDVLDQLDGALGYTTVAKVLDRLYAKGAVSRQKHGRSFDYRAVTDERHHVAGEIRSLLERSGDRTAALKGLVAGLDPGDAEQLRALLAEANRRRRGAP